MNKGLVITLLVAALAVGGLLFLLGRDGTDSLPFENNNAPEQTQDANGNDTDTNTIDGSANVDVSDTSKDTGAGQSDNTSSNTVVTYTDDGFSPASVTIAAGESVTFVNESSRVFWPASAIHPTHSLYPEKTGIDCLGSAFDACKALQSGESFTFTFNSTGSWNYHDHLRASKRGEIVVN